MKDIFEKIIFPLIREAIDGEKTQVEVPVTIYDEIFRAIFHLDYDPKSNKLISIEIEYDKDDNLFIYVEEEQILNAYNRFYECL